MEFFFSLVQTFFFFFFVAQAVPKLLIFLPQHPPAGITAMWHHGLHRLSL